MRKLDAHEAMPLIAHAMDLLMGSIASRGYEGSACRTAVGDLLAHSEEWLLADTIGRPLDNVFERAREAKASLVVLEAMRRDLLAHEPRLLGATLIRDSLVQFSLAVQCRIPLDTQFNNR